MNHLLKRMDVCDKNNSQFVPDKHLCEICFRVFRQLRRKQILLKCANCARVFCDSCCEIQMDFTVPIKVNGRTKYETGNYCTFKCMRIHHPGFFICCESDCEVCHKE